MAKGKKKKNNNVQTFSLGEFLEIDGNGEIPIYKEIDDGTNKIMINLSRVPSAPLSSFEIIVKPYILKCGSPYHLVAKNIPFDCTPEQIRIFFECETFTIEIQHDDANRSKGIAIMAFKNLEEYKTALEKDGLKIGTRSIHLTQGKLITEFDDRNNQRSDKKKFGENHNQERQDEMDSCLDWRAKKKSDVEYDREKTSDNISAAQSDGNWRSRQNTGEGSYGRVGDGKDENVSAAQSDDNWRLRRNAIEGGPDRIGDRKNENISAAQSDTNWRSGLNAGEGSSGCVELVENKNISAAQSDKNWRSDANADKESSNLTGFGKNENISAAQSDTNWRSAANAGGGSSSLKGFEKKEYSFAPHSDNSRRSRLIPSKEYTGRYSKDKRYEDSSEAMSDNNWKRGTTSPHVASSSTSNTSKSGEFFAYRNKNKSANAWNIDQKTNALPGAKDTNNNFDLSILRNPDKKIQAFTADSSTTRPAQSTRIYK